ncbi:MAG: hypothetical protein ABEJ99_05980 [Candidatus Nanohaloarchaea archaeon]
MASRYVYVVFTLLIVIAGFGIGYGLSTGSLTNMFNLQPAGPDQNQASSGNYTSPSPDLVIKDPSYLRTGKVKINGEKVTSHAGVLGQAEGWSSPGFYFSVSEDQQGGVHHGIVILGIGQSISRTFKSVPPNSTLKISVANGYYHETNLNSTHKCDDLKLGIQRQGNLSIFHLKQDGYQTFTFDMFNNSYTEDMPLELRNMGNPDCDISVQPVLVDKFYLTNTE